MPYLQASAVSISEALEAIAPGQLQVNIVDVFVEHTNFPFNRFPKMYQWFSTKPTLWEGVYKTSKLTSDTILGWEEPLALAWDADFQKCIQEENPDIIVSVHPLCQVGGCSACPAPLPSGGAALPLPSSGDLRVFDASTVCAWLSAGLGTYRMCLSTYPM